MTKTREIKFRAWVYSANRMFGPLVLGCFHGEEINVDFDGTSGTIFLDESEIMQYTGLRDKNGKEIFEGDIVRIVHPFRNREWTGPVIWQGSGFNGNGFWFTHFDNPGDLFSEGTEYIEVIGNIYESPGLLGETPENPELLAGEKHGKE